MKKSVSRKITVKGNKLFVRVGNGHTHNDYRTKTNYIGIKFPRRKYRVTYTLDPNGKYEVGVGGRSIHLYGEHHGDVFGVCFLPSEWYGRRVTRKAKVL